VSRTNSITKQSKSDFCYLHYDTGSLALTIYLTLDLLVTTALHGFDPSYVQIDLPEPTLYGSSIGLGCCLGSLSSVVWNAIRRRRWSSGWRTVYQCLTARPSSRMDYVASPSTSPTPTTRPRTRARRPRRLGMPRRRQRWRSKVSFIIFQSTTCSEILWSLRSRSDTPRCRFSNTFSLWCDRLLICSARTSV